jgi:hypothetical protein
MSQKCELCNKEYIDKESDVCPNCQEELYSQLSIKTFENEIEISKNGEQYLSQILSKEENKS